MPFPFLALCWRIGLSGQWVRLPAGAPDSRSPTRRAGPAALGGAPSPERRLRHGTGTVSLLPSFEDTGWRSPSGPSELARSQRTGTGTGAISRALERSALYRKVSERDEAAARRALLASMGLLLAPPGPARTRSLPPLWQPLAGATVPGRGPLWIPLPRARYDPLTWTLLDRLLEQWETEGLTFVGPERRQLYLRAGTRRMARIYGVSRRRALACGRAAYRIWRHWYETREGPRAARVRGFPLPPELDRTMGDPTRLYRAIRGARRRGRPTPYQSLLPAALAELYRDEADRSIASFPRRPIIPTWPRDPLPALASALRASPLALAARGVSMSDPELRRTTASLARRLLILLGAPWPWGTRR